MQKLIFFLSLFLVACISTNKVVSTPITEAPAALKEINAFQQKLTEEYENPTTSPLKEKATEFKGHEFFPIDLSYRVQATITPFKEEPFFTMPTSGPKKPAYRKYGLLKFQLQGKDYELTLFQNQAMMRNPLYRDYLFLPFTDLTTGESTYGGGRYIDMRLPKGSTMIVDFNQAYNPYCAYATGYSCPIPPEENDLAIAVKAGIKLSVE